LGLALAAVAFFVLGGIGLISLLFDIIFHASDTAHQAADGQGVIIFEVVEYVMLPASVYRVKGFLYLADQPAGKIVLQMVGRRVAVSVGGAWVGKPQTRLVFISRHQTVNYPAIEVALNSCSVESP
jgi:G3E family GTPase